MARVHNHDRVSCVVTGSKVARTTRLQRAHAVGRAHNRASWLYVVTQSSCIATGFPGMLGDLGRDKDFLCRNKVLLGPVSRPWTMS